MTNPFWKALQNKFHDGVHTVEGIFTSSEQEALKVATAAAHYVEQNGGKVLRDAASAAVLSAELTPGDGIARASAAVASVARRARLGGRARHQVGRQPRHRDGAGRRQGRGPDQPRHARAVSRAGTGSLMPLSTILIVILVLILVGVFPAWPHSQSFGYLPSGGVGLLIIILVILLLTGRI